MKQNDLNRILFSRRLNDDYSNIGELEEFFRTIKDNSEGYTKINSLDSNNNDEINVVIKNMHYKKFNDSFINTHGLGNIFFSVNSFNKDMNGRKYEYTYTSNGNRFINVSNKVEQLSTFNCIIMDIDFKHQNEYLKHKSDDELIELIRNVYEPTYIVRSGNGCHIYYNIENYTVDKNLRNEFLKACNSYRFCCGIIANKFVAKNIYPDPAVTGRIEKIIRVPFSYNIKDINNPKRTCIIYKNTEIKYNLKDLFFHFKKNNEKVHITNITSIKNKKLNVKQTNKQTNKSTKHINYGTLPSDLTIPYEDYNRRMTKTSNYNIFLNNAIDDIKFLVQHKDYSGRRNAILFHLVSILNDYNSKNDKQIDIESLFDYINEYFKLPKQELESLLNRTNTCKTSKEYLFKLMGINKIDETYMKALVISDEEKQRRLQIRIKENNDKNNAKRSKLNKTKKQEKIERENNLVKPLLNNHSLREIAKLTGFSVCKVQTIINRMK